MPANDGHERSREPIVHKSASVLQKSALTPRRAPLTLALCCDSRQRSLSKMKRT